MGAGKVAEPAPFLVKTHEMVEDSETDDVISWTGEGSAFVVWKPAEFARDLLPKHFKHNNFSSFVRQLNTYGFRKAVSERWEFTNENFRRGQPALLALIKRRRNFPQAAAAADQKCSSPSPTTSSNKDLEHPSFASAASASSPFHPIDTVRQENESLKKANRSLAEELAQVKQQNEALLGFLSKYADVAALRLAINMGDGEREEGPKLFGVRLREAEEDRARKRRCGGANGGDATGRAATNIIA